MVGSFGSGCTKIANEFIEDKGYKSVSLSKILRDFYYIEHSDKKGKDISRRELQNFGNILRQKNGNDFLAVKANELIDSEKEQEKWVIDSIRNEGEVNFFKDKYPNFYLIGIFADCDIRWKRVNELYDNDRREFDKDDTKDSGEKIEYGQRVKNCFNMSDIIISNEEDIPNIECETGKALKRKIERYIGLIEGKEFAPNEHEGLMAMAYANSLRSKCYKRKVGALIVDDYGHIISSGYNEVPSKMKACADDFGECYRDRIRNNNVGEFRQYIKDNVEEGEVINSLKEKYKMLDYCRALHAEESAIINIARFGSSNLLKGATLYSTTYPCNLCANKIVQVGIKKVIYVEPYPQEEAKKILKNIKTEPFEGVLYNGYFKFKTRR
jgi:deoxycytidylate deaminase